MKKIELMITGIIIWAITMFTTLCISNQTVIVDYFKYTEYALFGLAVLAGILALITYSRQ